MHAGHAIHDDDAKAALGNFVNRLLPTCETGARVPEPLKYTNGNVAIRCLLGQIFYVSERPLPRVRIVSA